MKRYQCIFQNCNCRLYSHKLGNTCKVCNHGKVWHSTKESPPNDRYLQFFSIRKQARTPKYSTVNIYNINQKYCVSVDDLPA